MDIQVVPPENTVLSSLLRLLVPSRYDGVGPAISEASEVSQSRMLHLDVPGS